MAPTMAPPMAPKIGFVLPDLKNGLRMPDARLKKLARSQWLVDDEDSEWPAMEAEAPPNTKVQA